MNSEVHDVRIPRNTYRLQISAEFDLFAAADLIPYLHRLGVDWVHLSPLLRAEPGSSHGYDVVEHDRIDPARGGPEGLAALSSAARAHRMGLLVDIVPNHMGVATPAQNPWWWDLLAHGRDSAYSSFFDVDWAAGSDRVLLPVVGEQDLVQGRIRNLSLGEGPRGPELRYHQHRFPIAAGTGHGEPEQVHARQHYALVGWRSADTDLNYRRFFAVNSLAAVRVEERAVFDATHVEVRRWFTEGLVDGLRIDHPDGLRDPAGYLRDLAELTGDAYVVVEKILEPGEELEPAWDTQGSTGYDALAWIDRVLTDPGGEAPLSALQNRLRGHDIDWADLIHDTKRAVADGALQAEVRRIARELPEVPGAELPDAVAELLACFGVYRSYLPAGREHLEQAFAEARRRRPDLADVFDRLLPELGEVDRPAALRFQQTSGMVMAKGVEDCAFYRHSRLTSLNEVGGDPSRFSVDPARFHGAMELRQAEWPDAMVTLSTHDTKRSEDVRARISVLSEVPQAWAETVDALLRLVPLPDPGFGSLLWQAVLGAWVSGADGEPEPDLRGRLHGYAEKAMREAGDRTTWTAPEQDYERLVHRAVDSAFDDQAVRGLLDALLSRIAGPGRSNSLSAKLMALTIPGVPDVYQGSELWEQSLVDPDNRRGVDFELRQHHLDRLEAGDRPALDAGGVAKLLFTQAALRARRDQPDRFTRYQPVLAEGPSADHLLAFDRGGAITVVTRMPLRLAEQGWRDTELRLPAGGWVDAVTGARFSGAARAGEVLADYPAALLLRERP